MARFRFPCLGMGSAARLTGSPTARGTICLPLESAAQYLLFLLQCPKLGVLGRVHAVPKPSLFWAGAKPMIYGYIRTSRAAADGLAGMHPETQLQALADAGVEPVNIVSDVGISGSVPV